MFYDLIVVGAGMAGIPCAIFAADRGFSVLLVEAGDTLGGKLSRSSGQISAACTRLQTRFGIYDSPDAHLRDVWRICQGTAELPLVRLAVDNAGDTVDWLMDIGVEFPDDHPVLTYAHDIYTARRYQWPLRKGKGILDALIPLVAAHVTSNRITIKYKTEMVSILKDTGGIVLGIRTQDINGTEESVESSAVALTAGGYTNDPELFAKFSPHAPVYAAKLNNSNGKALRVAIAANCDVSGGHLYKGMLGGILEDPDDNYSVKLAINTVPQDRPPWEIWVNLLGRRFTREDHPSATYREHAVNAQPGLKFFIIFDEGVRQNAPPLTTAGDKGLAALLEANPTVQQASTLADLSSLIGINELSLKQTIVAYNHGVETGNDAYGREHLPRSLEHPPFYAITSVAFAMPSPAGVKIDEQLRVLGTDGLPIKNLYAAGEIIGNTRIMGNAYVSGMGVGPTLTFGRLLGQRLIPGPPD